MLAPSADRALLELTAILENASVALVFTQKRLIQRCNRRTAEIFGYHDADELCGLMAIALYPDAESYERLVREAEAMLSQGRSYHGDWLMRRADGSPVWCNLYGKAVDPEDPDGGAVWIIEDVTEARLAAEALARGAREMEAIMDNAPIGIFFTRDRRLVRYNAKVAEIAGFEGDSGVGLPTRVFFGSDEEYEALGREVEPLLSRGEPFQKQLFLRRRDGSQIWVNLVAYVQNVDNTREGTVWLLEDRTERKRAEDLLRHSHEELEARVKERTAKLQSEVVQRRRAEERLKYLAQHDSLTGLANRNLLRNRMARLVEQSIGNGQVGAVLFIDLDRFKNVNDSLGHRVGDGLLKEVARRIAGAVRAVDVVARLGGDEFVVVACALDGRPQAEAIAAKIMAALQQPIRVQQHELFATPSIGIALFPEDDSVPDALVQKADAAMYQAKAAGRGTIRFFDPDIAANTERYLRTESSLRRAIERQEFETYYQPIVHLESLRCESLELLVRWRHPELGLVSPADFIPIAEDSGLVGRVGAQVLDAACRQHVAWRAAGYEVPRFALNLSAVQLRDRRHLASLAETLVQHGMSPTQVELEITETTLMQDGDRTLAILEALSHAGFGLSIDDFGTGYSSLAYLKSFPVGKLKIDKSFIRDMTRNPDDEAIVRMIVALARTLHLDTVAEGVETQAQWQALQRLGCDYAQGYLFARPMSAVELEQGSLGQDQRKRTRTTRRRA